MQALVLLGPRRLELQDLPIPSPGPGEVLIHTQVSSISTGSEVIRYLNGAGPDIGYLNAGVVVEVGAGVTQVKAGDRVRCGQPHHEYVVAPADGVSPIPDGVAFDQAAYAYLPTLVLHALRLCDYRLGENVAVIGQGVVGLMGTALAQAMGVRVVALDTEPSRLDVARQMGIEHALNPLAPGFQDRLRDLVGDKGLDMTVDATGSYHGLVSALELTRRWGRVAILGMYRPHPPDPAMAARLHAAYLRHLHSKELRLVGCSNDPAEEYPPHIYRFTIHDNTRLSLDLLAQRKYTLGPAITHRFTPQDGSRLYERLQEREVGMLGVVYDWR